jgi:hypothetical protein
MRLHLVERFGDVGGMFPGSEFRRDRSGIARQPVFGEGIFHGLTSNRRLGQGEPIRDQAIRTGAGFDNRLGPSLGIIVMVLAPRKTRATDGQ